MKTNCLYLFFILCVSIGYGQNEKKASEFIYVGLINDQNDSYRFRMQSDGQSFQLKVCLNTDCKDPYEYIKTMDPDAFVNAVLAQINTQHSKRIPLAQLQANSDDATIKAILDAIKAYDEQQVRADLNEIQNRFRDIENAEDQFSGLLTLNDSIPYEVTYAVERSKIKGNQRTDFYQLIKDGNNSSSNKKDKKYGVVTTKGKGILKIKNALVHFFNNKASSIYIEAELISEATREAVIFLNNDFSVPLRFFNMYGSTVTKDLGLKLNGRRVSITIDYNDVFDYKSDQFFNYSVANDQVMLSNEDEKSREAQVKQRRFFDFFTAIINSDLMGFNTENPNSLINAQARLIIPLNLRNVKKFTFGRQFTAMTNIALQNSFEDETRFIDLKDTLTVNSFDLLRKNNLYGKIGLEILTHEAKGWFTNIALGYNVGFYRTGFRYTQTQDNTTDIVTSRQILSIGHGPFLNFEIRPQSNFGADVTFALEDLNYADVASINDRRFENDILVNSSKDRFIVPYNIINLEANFYWLTNPQKAKGGIYAKLGAYFHTDSDEVFPQFMVGYATNLTSFVDRFTTKTPEEDLKN